jgi:hypothetical protein
MIKDFLISFKDNFNEKTRNPFLGTYLIVWLIRNWELVYSLFNFNKNQNLEDKVKFIKTYYENNEFLYNLWVNTYWAFGLLTVTYILLNLSRLITNFSEKKLTPWIYKITDSKSIVTKDVYDNLIVENNRLEQKVEKERESKNRLQIEITKLEQKIDELNKFPETDTVLSENINTLDNEVDILFDKIKTKKWFSEYLSANSLINKNEYNWVSNKSIGEPFEYFIALGLINVDKNDGSESQLSVSEIGKKVLRRVRLEL